MQQIPFWQAHRCSASHGIPAFYENRRFMTVLITARALFPCWARLFQSTHYFFNIQFNTIFSRTPTSSKWPLSFTFPHQNHTRILLPQRVTTSAHLIHLDLITLIKSGEGFRWRSSSARNFWNRLLPRRSEARSRTPSPRVYHLMRHTKLHS